MKRDLTKAIEEYKRRFGNRNSCEGAFYGDDIVQIFNFPPTAKMYTLSPDDIWHMIGNALEAGFMVGYRKGLRDSRKRAKRRKPGTTQEG